MRRRLVGSEPRIHGRAMAGSRMLLRVKAVPGASRDGVAGLLGDRLKVRVSAPAEGGRANRAIVRAIAAELGIRPAAVAIESGHGSAEKVVRVEGAPAGTAERWAAAVIAR